MKRLQGKPILPGYALGTAVVLEIAAESIPTRCIHASQRNTEVRRLHCALARSTHELEHVPRRVLDELGKSHSAIFEAHLTILRDPSFSARIKACIESRFVSAEHAVLTSQGNGPPLKNGRCTLSMNQD